MVGFHMNILTDLGLGLGWGRVGLELGLGLDQSGVDWS